MRRNSILYFFSILIFCWLILSTTLTLCLAQQSHLNSTNGYEIEDVGEPDGKRVKKSYMKLFESIFDLLKSIYKSVVPYLSFGLPGIDWNKIEETIDTFRQALSKADASFKTAGAAGLVAVGIGAVTGPYILNFIKMIISSFIGFVDNLYFVATGQALAGREIPEDIWNDLFQVTIERLTAN